MTGDFVFRVLLGHLVGDYLLQNNWMALNKKNRLSICCAHCFVYTMSIVVAILPELSTCKNTILISGLIFLSHILFDYFDIIEHYLRLIRGHSWMNALADIHNNLNIAYTALVQTVADNTAHLLLMYFIFKYLLFN